MSATLYSTTITTTPDPQFYRYLARQVGQASAKGHHLPTRALPLDISLDDLHGDVVAGLAGWTCRAGLSVALLWVHPRLRGQGIGARLLHTAEDIARERGCGLARVSTHAAGGYYQRQGYQISGMIQAFPDGQSLLWLEKPLHHDQAARRQGA